MYYKTDKMSCFYEKHGNNNKIILILPGWGDTRNTFRYLIDYLKNDYTIYILDYPGFGNSPFPDHDLDIFDYTMYIIQFMNHFSIKNPIIISHSFGGRISILLTGFYNIQVSKMILISSAGIKQKRTLKNIIKTYTYKLLKKINFFLPKNKREQYKKKLLNTFGSSDYSKLSSNMMKTFRQIIDQDLSCYLSNINSEVLLIWGEIDEDTPLKDGLLMRKKMKHSALITIPNSSHYVHLQNPLLVNKIVKEFIKSE